MSEKEKTYIDAFLERGSRKVAGRGGEVRGRNEQGQTLGRNTGAREGWEGEGWGEDVGLPVKVRVGWVRVRVKRGSG